MNIAIILAGGKGQRVGGHIPKQFINVNGKPVIAYTLEKFQECELIDGICVVCIEGWLDKIEEIKERYDLSKIKWICEGDNTGLKSLRNGIEILSECGDEDLILVHDAVRPFIDLQSIEENIRVAKKYGVAMTSVDCDEDCVNEDENHSSKVLANREQLKRILTPQTFSFGLMKSLFENVNLDTETATSMFILYLKSGGTVYCSEGNSKNIKLTYLSDIEYFRHLFKDERV